MTIKKCPLCSGTVSKGQCIDCGYFLPDEDELRTMSSLYDFDPDTYPEPEKYQTTVEEMGADLKYAEPEPPKASPLKAEVRSSGGGNLPARQLPPQSFPPPPKQSGAGKGRISFAIGDIRRSFLIWFLITLFIPIPVIPGLVFGLTMLKKAQNQSETLLGVLCLLVGILK